MLMKIFEHLSIIIRANNSFQWRIVVDLLEQTIISLRGAILSTSREERQPHDSADSRLSFRGEKRKRKRSDRSFFYFGELIDRMNRQSSEGTIDGFNRIR
jgi:hypothetical protein